MKTGTFLLGAGAATAAGLAIWYFTRGPWIAPCEPYGLCDINDDGVIDQADVDLVMQCVLGNCEPWQMERADANQDGVVTMGDATAIEAYIATQQR